MYKAWNTKAEPRTGFTENYYTRSNITIYMVILCCTDLLNSSCMSYFHKLNILCLHRFYLISGGVPFIICGVTAATNLKNYGNEDNAQ